MGWNWRPKARYPCTQCNLSRSQPTLIAQSCLAKNKTDTRWRALRCRAHIYCPMAPIPFLPQVCWGAGRDQMYLGVATHMPLKSTARYWSRSMSWAHQASPTCRPTHTTSATVRLRWLCEMYDTASWPEPDLSNQRGRERFPEICFVSLWPGIDRDASEYLIWPHV